MDEAKNQPNRLAHNWSYDEGFGSGVLRSRRKPLSNLLYLTVIEKAHDQNAAADITHGRGSQP